jgi:chromosomal replication initiator protein
MWNQCLRIIKENVNTKVYETWFVPITAKSYLNDELLLEVPSQFFYEWIEEHFYALIQQTINSVLGPSGRLRYEVVIDKGERKKRNKTVRLPSSRKGVSPTQNALPFSRFERTTAPAPSNSSLNPRYTFDNFIRGESNQLAAAAALAISDNPGSTRYNPFVLYGETGLGKTHLVQAIGNRAMSLHPGIRVTYTNSERFTMEYVTAIQKNNVNEFTNTYRNVDILIVDDIQFFSGKEKTQDSFFHIFNSLHQSGKQIILTSDKPLKELHGVNERLISRFQWGLTADIQPPDFEMRMAILQKKADDEGCEIEPAIVEYIARHVNSSVRELEGCFVSLMAKLSFDGREQTLDLAKEVISGVGIVSAPTQITARMIIEKTAEYFGLSIEQVTGKSRKQEFVMARQVAMYLIKELTQTSLKSIGAEFNGRDHTTVIHSCQMVQNYIEIKHARVNEAVQNLKRQLQN